MHRIATLALAIVLLPAAAQADSLRRPTIKREVVVTADVVRLGDVVTNAGATAHIAIFRSPDPGETGSVTAEQIVEAARNQGLVGIDLADTSEIRVSRAGRAYSAKQISALLARALGAQYATDANPNFLIDTLDQTLRTQHVESTDGEPSFARLIYDPRSGKFEGLLRLPGKSTLLALSGRAIDSAEVPVLTRTLNRAEVIKQSDITRKIKPKSEIGPDPIAAADEAVGQAVRRSLRGDQTIQRADLMRPEVIQRNEAVTITFESPGILIAARGKAIDPGGEGDLINVTNVQSKRTVQARVIGPGHVSIALPNRATRVAAAPAGDQTE